jgi:dTDP-4-dehydrorhamnose reductase
VKALITGGGGQLGSDLAALLGPQAVVYGHTDLDITDESAVARVLEAESPDVVFNCAAFHNLGACETDPASAWSVNVDAVRTLARHAAKLVHISTNYVFDGRREDPYGEGDLPAPRSIYAISKLAGEHAALAYGAQSLVIRTTGLYGLAGNASKGGNFVERMLARAREHGKLSVVADQLVQPTFTADLAAAIVAAVAGEASGVVHLTAAGACSWHEFTQAIIANAGLDVPVEPGTTVIGSDGVDRPLNGLLARPRADALGVPQLRPWRTALDDYMTRAGLSAAPAH